jgi:hypothetical protein
MEGLQVDGYADGIGFSKQGGHQSTAYPTTLRGWINSEQ